MSHILHVSDIFLSGIHSKVYLMGDRLILNVIFLGLSIVMIHGFEFLTTGMWKSPSIEFSNVFLQESYHLEPACFSALFFILYAYCIIVLTLIFI